MRIIGICLGVELMRSTQGWKVSFWGSEENSVWILKWATLLGIFCKISLTPVVTSYYQIHARNADAHLSAAVLCYFRCYWCRNLAAVNCILHWIILTLSMLQMNITIERGGRPARPFSEMPWGPPIESFALSFCIVLLNGLLITLEPGLISSEARHMFVRIKQNLCAYMPKGAPQQFECVDQWFLTGGGAPPQGGVKQFPGGHEPLHALQHRTFFNGNVSLPNVVFCNVAVHLHDINFLQYSLHVLVW